MKSTKLNGIVILELEGDISEYSLEAHQELLDLMREVIMTDAHREPRVVADLSKVRFMNSSGLAQLISAHTSAKTRRARFALCNVPRRVQLLLDITHLSRVLEIYGTLKDARAALED